MNILNILDVHKITTPMWLCSGKLASHLIYSRLMSRYSVLNCWCLEGICAIVTRLAAAAIWISVLGLIGVHSVPESIVVCRVMSSISRTKRTWRQCWTDTTDPLFLSSGYFVSPQGRGRFSFLCQVSFSLGVTCFRPQLQQDIAKGKWSSFLAEIRICHWIVWMNKHLVIDENPQIHKCCGHSISGIPPSHWSLIWNPWNVQLQWHALS